MARPVTFRLRNSGCIDAGSDGFAQHGDWVLFLCDLTGMLWTDRIGKQSMVPICPGIYRFNLRAGSNGLRVSAGGQAALINTNTNLADTPSVLEMNYLEGDSLTIDDNCTGFIKEFKHTPRLEGTGNTQGLSVVPSSVEIGKYTARREVVIDPASIAAGETYTYPATVLSPT